MANSSKEYAYYLEGNKIAIVEKDVSFDNNVDSKDYGPGVSRQRWESPQSSVTNGLEVNYVYAPTYNLNFGGFTIPNSSTQGAAIFGIFGWTVIGGYLSFVVGPGQLNNGYTNFASSGLDEELGTAGTDSILIGGSSRWNGVHKIKARGDGYLQTNTKFSSILEIQTLSIDLHDEDFTVDDDNVGNGISYLFQNDSSNTVYFFLRDGDINSDGTQTVATANQQIFKATFDGNYTLTVSHTLFIDTLLGATATVGTGITWSEIAITGDYMDDVTNGDYHLNKIIKDNCVLYGKSAFNNMEDESFELDLPNYLQKALVYYIKGKLAEDSGNIELKEYSMREFKKMIEKHENSRISGLRIISSGLHAIR